MLLGKWHHLQGVCHTHLHLNQGPRVLAQMQTMNFLEMSAFISFSCLSCNDTHSLRRRMICHAAINLIWYQASWKCLNLLLVKLQKCVIISHWGTNELQWEGALLYSPCDKNSMWTLWDHKEVFFFFTVWMDGKRDLILGIDCGSHLSNSTQWSNGTVSNTNKSCERNREIPQTID